MCTSCKDCPGVHKRQVNTATASHQKEQKGARNRIRQTRHTSHSSSFSDALHTCAEITALACSWNIRLANCFEHSRSSRRIGHNYVCSFERHESHVFFRATSLHPDCTSLPTSNCGVSNSELTASTSYRLLVVLLSACLGALIGLLRCTRLGIRAWCRWCREAAFMADTASWVNSSSELSLFLATLFVRFEVQCVRIPRLSSTGCVCHHTQVPLLSGDTKVGK